MTAEYPITPDEALLECIFAEDSAEVYAARAVASVSDAQVKAFYAENVTRHRSKSAALRQALALIRQQKEG